VAQTDLDGMLCTKRRSSQWNLLKLETQAPLLLDNLNEICKIAWRHVYQSDGIFQLKVVVPHFDQTQRKWK